MSMEKCHMVLNLQIYRNARFAYSFTNVGQLHRTHMPIVKSSMSTSLRHEITIALSHITLYSIFQLQHVMLITCSTLYV